MNNKQKITGFFALKGIAILFVIMVHVISFNPIDDPEPDFIKSQAFSFIRFIFNLGVPLFFVISGYLLSNSLSTGKFGRDVFDKKVKRLLFPLIFWAVFYLIFPEIDSIINYGFLRAYYWRVASCFKDISYFLSTLGTGHLWYLVSSIFGLFFVKAILFNNNIPSLIPTLFLFAFYPIASKHFHPYFVEATSFNPRPGFIFASAYMALGVCLKRYEPHEKQIFIYSILLMIAAHSLRFIYATHAPLNIQVYFDTLKTMLFSSAFVLIFKNIKFNENGFLSIVGQKTLGLYAIHIAFLKFMNIYWVSKSYLAWFLFAPLLSFGISYVFVGIMSKKKLTRRLVV